MSNVFCLICDEYPVMIKSAETHKSFTAEIVINQVSFSCDLNINGGCVHVLITGISGNHTAGTITNAASILNDISHHISRNIAFIIKAGLIQNFKFN